MQKVQNKFAYYEQIQNKMSQRLDTLDQLMEELEKRPKVKKDTKEEVKVNYIDEDKEYQQKLNEDLENLMTKVNDNIISTNYLNFYDFLLRRRNIQQKPQPQPIMKEEPIQYANASTQADFHRSNSVPQKISLSILNSRIPKSMDTEAKNLLHKKQNAFLTNELTSLKLKLNKLQNDNEKLNSLVRSTQKVNNYKFLEKFINNFVEKLAINWNDIVEEIIEDLLIQEVYQLNELELQKMNYNELRVTTFADILKNAPTQEMKYDLMFDSLDEVSKMISYVKKKEQSIGQKYNFNLN